MFHNLHINSQKVSYFEIIPVKVNETVLKKCEDDQVDFMSNGDLRS